MLEDSNVQYITVDQIPKFLAYSIHSNLSPMFWSPPGVGKSEILASCAEYLGYHLEIITLSIYESIDLRGLPTKGIFKDYMDFQTTKNNVIDEDPYNYYDMSSTGAIVEWAMPDFLVRARKARLTENKPTLFFFDELTHADEDRQSPAYQFLLEHRIGCFSLHKDDKTCAAGNYEDDLAISNPLSSALANRICHYYVKADAAAFCSWGRSNNIYPDLISCIERNPDLIYEDYKERFENTRCKGFSSPRTLKFCSDMCYTILHSQDEISNISNDNIFISKNRPIPLNLFEDKKLTEVEKFNDLSYALSGLVGIPVSNVLLTFIRVGSKVPKPSDICSGSVVSFNDDVSAEDIDVLFVTANQCVSYLVSEYNAMDYNLTNILGFEYAPDYDDLDDEPDNTKIQEAIELQKQFFDKYSNFILFLMNNFGQRIDLIISTVITKLTREQRIPFNDDFVDDKIFDYISSLINKISTKSLNQ